MKRTPRIYRPGKRALAADAIADEWRALQPYECHWCGWPDRSRVWPNAIFSRSHEIVCGTGTRQTCLADPAALLVLCDRCHVKMHLKLAKVDAVVMGLAIKSIADPAHYDLRRVVKEIWKPGCTEEFIKDIRKKVAKARKQLRGDA